MDHLNGVCEQSVTTCLMATLTCYVPKNGAMYLALRGGKHASAMLDWMKQADRGCVGPSHACLALKKREGGASGEKRITDAQ